MSVLNNKSCESIGNVFSIVRLLSKNKKGLKVCHMNAQSLGGTKIDEFRYIFEESGVDLICISETWFKPGMPDNLYQHILIYLAQTPEIGQGLGRFLNCGALKQEQT